MRPAGSRSLHHWSAGHLVAEGDVPGGALVAVAESHDQRGAVGDAAAGVAQHGADPGIGDRTEIVGGHLADLPFLAGCPGAGRHLDLGADPRASDVQATAVDPQRAVAVAGPLLGTGARAAFP